MPSASKLSSLLLALWVLCFALPATGGARAYLTEATPAGAAGRERPGTEILTRTGTLRKKPPRKNWRPRPSNWTFPISRHSCRSSTRRRERPKEQAVLARLAHAKALVEGGADLKATDAQGRTALHWAIFGSSYHVKPNILVAYEEIADSLIQRGVEINKQDVYQDTALDYLLYSPSFEMQTLLIENGASSGFLAAFYTFFNQVSTNFPPTHAAAVALTRKADLAPGATMSVRLDVPVYSDRSRTGDPIEATVTYPLCRSGELLACKDGRTAGLAWNQGEWHGAVCGQGAGQIFAAAAGARLLEHCAQEWPAHAALRPCARCGQCPRDGPQQRDSGDHSAACFDEDLGGDGGPGRRQSHRGLLHQGSAGGLWTVPAPRGPVSGGYRYPGPGGAGLHAETERVLGGMATIAGESSAPAAGRDRASCAPTLRTRSPRT